MASMTLRSGLKEAEQAMLECDMRIRRLQDSIGQQQAQLDADAAYLRSLLNCGPSEDLLSRANAAIRSGCRLGRAQPVKIRSIVQYHRRVEDGLANATNQNLHMRDLRYQYEDWRMKAERYRRAMGDKE